MFTHKCTRKNKRKTSETVWFSCWRLTNISCSYKITNRKIKLLLEGPFILKFLFSNLHRYKFQPLNPQAIISKFALLAVCSSILRKNGRIDCKQLLQVKIKFEIKILREKDLYKFQSISHKNRSIRKIVIILSSRCIIESPVIFWLLHWIDQMHQMLPSGKFSYWDGKFYRTPTQNHCTENQYSLNKFAWAEKMFPCFFHNPL